MLPPISSTLPVPIFLASSSALSLFSRLKMPKTMQGWLPKLKKGGGPFYLMIANAIAEDIALGRLIAEQRLPTQRKLAQLLGLDFTTVARAYTEAHRRGLVDAVVGRGTFVSGRRRPHVPHIASGRSSLDLSMNMPPEPDIPELLATMRKDFVAVGLELRDLMRYQNFCGSEEDRSAGALWLRRRGLTVDADRLLVVPGAQCALLAILTTIARHGSVVCCEDLTYPGLRALAHHLGIRLVGLPMDAEGIDAVAFAAACSQYAPVALYCNPTLLNPTTATISASRRMALVEVARHYKVAIIEDDAYGFLQKDGPAALASIGADITFYVAGLSKSVGAGLRVAYLAAPDSLMASKLSTALRATTIMGSPITLALATRWIRDGTADLMLSAIRKETNARQKIAVRILPAGCFSSMPDAFHLWLQLPGSWSATAFALHLKKAGIGVVASTAFCVGIEPPAAVRICIGGVSTRNEIEQAFIDIRSALASPPSFTGGIL